MWAKHKQNGFTIVELLIVIVVIGILAAIVIVAYNGIQARARDAQRVADMNAITKALELYKIQTGQYPTAVGNSPGGWEVSSVTPDTFLSALRTSGVASKVPVDPVNTGDMQTAGSKIYAYFLYPAGYLGCPAASGQYYVLIARTGDGASPSPNSPNFICGTYSTVGWWWATGRVSS